MGTKPSTQSYAVNYLDYPEPGQVRIDEVAAFYSGLTGRRVFTNVRRLIAIVTRIHADDTERLLQEVFDVIGVDNLLRVLADTPRGKVPDILVSRRATSANPGTTHSSPPRHMEPAPSPQSEAEPPLAAPSPTLPVEPARSQDGGVRPVAPSEWWDGTEDWPVRPRRIDPDRRVEGVIYTPDTCPPFDPTSRQRWDRRFWETEAANRIEGGDLTLAARLTFWELLTPEGRVLPDPAVSATERPS